MFSLLQNEVEFAIRAVQAGCMACRMVQTELVPAAIAKEDRSPVTVADFAAQAIIARLLRQTFPDDPLVGEEAGDTLRGDPATLDRVAGFVARFEPDATPRSVPLWIDRGQGEPGPRFWTLDPVDGTKGFLRGDQYAVALALLVNGQVVLGVLGCPNLNRNLEPEKGGEGALLVAVRGEGAYVSDLNLQEFPLPAEAAPTPPDNRAWEPGPQTGDLSSETGYLRDTRFPDAFTRLHVSEYADPAQARLMRSFESAHTSDEGTEGFVAALGMAGAPVRMDSQAKYALLAAGKAEMLLRLLSPKKPDYEEKIWDQAAGSIILEEAGGRISDLRGRALDFTAGRTLARNRGVLATNGWLHEAALAVISDQ